MVYQTERCPNTGRLHLQGYMELSKSLRIAAIIKWGSGFDRSHLSVRRGSAKEASDYCEKEESRADGPAFKFGRMSDEQSDRHSVDDQLAEVYRRMIEEDKGWVDLCKDEATRKTAFRFHAAITKLESFVRKPRGRPNVYVTLHIGPRGMGKTVCACFQEDGVTEKEDTYMYVLLTVFLGYLANAYNRATIADGSNRFWLGYTGETEVVFDEFVGGKSFTSTEFNNICSSAKTSANVKGAHVPFKGEQIHICSNFCPSKWWGPGIPYETAIRRIHVVHYHHAYKEKKVYVSDVWDENPNLEGTAWWKCITENPEIINIC